MTTLAGLDQKHPRDANQNSQRFLSDVPPLNPRLHFWYPGFHTFPEWWCRSYYVGQLGWSHLRLQLKDVGWSGEWIEAPGKQENDSLVIMTTVGFKRGVGILAHQTPLRTWLAFRWAGCEIKAHGRPWPSKVTQSMFSLAEIATYNGMEIIRKRRWTEWLVLLTRNLFEVLLQLQSWHNFW